MKVRSSVKRICKNCKIVKRTGTLFVICKNKDINKDKDNYGKSWWN